MDKLSCTWSGFELRPLELLVPPLLLLRPRRSEELPEAAGGYGKTPHGHTTRTGRSMGGTVLTFSLICLTIFRFTCVRDLMQVKHNGFVPFLWFSHTHTAEPLTYVFWYAALLVIVYASYDSRPVCNRRKLASKLMVPEVLALFILCLADSALVVVCDHDENELGDVTLAVDLESPWLTDLGPAFLDDLPRLWFMINLAVLIGVTIVGNISPPSGTTRGAIFDGIWALFVSQLVAMMFQRIGTRTKVGLHVLRHNTTLAICCGLSVLWCTHSLAMSLAIVFRQHEHEHSVPTVGQVWRQLTQRRALPRILKVLAFCISLCAFNSLLEPGMMENPHEELFLLALNGMALVMAARVSQAATRCEHPSWEASLICVVGVTGSFCWWAELCGPGSSLQDSSFQRAVSILFAAVTQLVLTALFADIFRRRLEPTAGQSLFFTFWACTMLVIGSKLEHHSAVHLVCHHKRPLRVWEVLEHMGEFGVCEFGLISTMSWFTYMAQKAAWWWDSHPNSGLHQPLL